MNRLTVGLLLGLIAGVPGGAVIHAQYVRQEAPLTQSQQAFSDDPVRDQRVADRINKLDVRLKKAACEGYIGGLKEQNLNVSSIIKNACSES